MSKPYGVRAVINALGRTLLDRLAAASPFHVSPDLAPALAAQPSRRTRAAAGGRQQPSNELCRNH